MSYGGSVAAMISTLKNNRALLTKRDRYFRAKTNYLKTSNDLKITYRKATKEELRQVKEKLRVQKKSDKLKTVIFIIVFIPLISFSIYYSLNFFENKMNEKQVIIKKKDINKYLFYINDGDKMFEDKKWNNAIYQYSNALEIFPNEFDVQYRLAQAYTYKCQHTNEDCFKSDSLINRLTKYFPENKQLQDLKKVVKNQLHD